MAIISHKYEFIFVKTAKTAGTAFEVSVSQVCGPDDIVTPIFPPEPRHQPRNFIQEAGEYWSHMPARTIREFLGPERFGRYFKFCIERHPVSKCISQFAMRKNSPHHQNEISELTWAEYVERGSFPVATERYLDADGSLLVDRILRYENLEEELNDVFTSLSVPWTGMTSRAKSGFRNGIIREHQVTPEQRQRIMEAFKPTLRFTGYS